MKKLSEIEFVLAIDAGGTKTIGLLKNIVTGKTWYARDASASLSHNLQEACQRIDNTALKLVRDSQCDFDNVIIVCGAAGAGNPDNREVLSAKLNQNFDHIHIYNDGRTSLYGASSGKPVIVLAMGTGSIAMRLNDDGIEERFGGWGFTVGDLGSGANMGRALVRTTLVELDKNQIGNDLLLAETVERMVSDDHNKINTETEKGDDRIERNNLSDDKRRITQSISQWIKSATPTDFAAFSPLIFEYADQSQLAKTIINDAAFWLEDLAKTAGFGHEKYEHLPIMIIGGLAQAITPFLSIDLQKRLAIPDGNSVDGAIFLGNKMIEKQTNESN